MNNSKRWWFWTVVHYVAWLVLLADAWDAPRGLVILALAFTISCSAAIRGEMGAEDEEDDDDAESREIGPVDYEQSDGYWVASMPSFPGAFTQSRSKDEATAKLLRLVAELIETYSQKQSRAE